QDLEHSLDGFLGIGPAGWSGEVEPQALLADEADERPMVDEGSAAGVAEVVEYQSPGRAVTDGHLQDVDELLDREPTLRRPRLPPHQRRDRPAGPQAVGRGSCEWELVEGMMGAAGVGEE